MSRNIHIPISEEDEARIRRLQVLMNKKYFYDVEVEIVRAGLEALEKKFAPPAQRVHVTVEEISDVGEKPVKPG